MNTNLKDALLAVESMLLDIQNDYSDELEKSKELSCTIEHSRSKISDARVEFGKLMLRNTASIDSAKVSSIILSKNEQWLLISLSRRPRGISNRLINSEHVRVILNGLIEQVDDRFIITEKGLGVVKTFKK